MSFDSALFSMKGFRLSLPVSIYCNDSYICNGGSLLVEGIVQGVVLLLQSINLVDHIE